MPTANVCIDENLGTGPTGRLQLRPWASPRPVVDVLEPSRADGAVTADTAMPGTLLIDRQVDWTNDSPLPQTMLLRITRGSKTWVVSNPNAIQFRDRWTYDVNRPPEAPVTTGIFNSQCGGALDVGTNTFAEPLPGVLWRWSDVICTDEWVPAPLEPGQTLKVWYRCYRWTPPPWSDNANLNSPVHSGSAGYARIQLIAYPQQGTVVTG